MKKKVGAVPGRLSFTCAEIVRSSRVTVASKVSPRPSATTTDEVDAPGRVRLASARRRLGCFGRGNAISTRRKIAAATRNTISAPATPARK